MDNGNGKAAPCRIWELIPVNFHSPATQSPVLPRNSSPGPPHGENAENNCCSHLTAEPSDDGFGTTVIEVTTVTTRKAYRLDD